MPLHSVKAICRDCENWEVDSYFSDNLEGFAEYHIKLHPGHIIDFQLPTS